MERSTVTHAIARLVDEDLVLRAQRPKQRHIHVSPTSKGEALADEIALRIDTALGRSSGRNSGAA
jgi:DNA-binding MarR family transcriptional regulator